MKRLVLIFVILIASFIALRFSNVNQKTPAQSLDTLIVGTSSDFKPLSFKEGDTIVGFDIDLINEIGKRLGKTIVLKDMPFEVLLPQIQLGSIHMIAAGMSPTPERAKHALFSNVYLKDNPLVAVTLAKNGPITHFDALKTKQVIVNQNYIADTELSKIPDISLIRLTSVSDALMSLDAGRGDVFVTARNTMKPVLDARGQDTYHLFVLPNTEEETALVISKEYPELAQQINAILDAMIADGTLDALKEKWL